MRTVPGRPAPLLALTGKTCAKPVIMWDLPASVRHRYGNFQYPD
jgi:hypothetical protein